MKKSNKIISLLLAIVMTLAIGSAVFAADEPAAQYSITVKNQSSVVSIAGNTYDAYKLFDLVYSGEAYAYSISAENPFFKNAKSVLENYFTLTVSASDPDTYVVMPKAELTAADTRALADALQAYLPEEPSASGTVAEGEESVKIDLTEAGYYLVFGTTTTTDGKEQTVTAALALTNADPDGEANVKADAPAITKVIVEADSNNGGEGLGTAQDVGTVVDFKLTSKVPTTTSYTKYEFIVHDVMTEGLTFDATSVKVYVGVDETGAPAELAADDFVVTVPGTEESDACTFEVKIPDLLATEEVTTGEDDAAVTETVRKYNDGDEIVITYSALLNAGALETDVETNTVYLEYSNNPYDETTAVTPEITVYVYDFAIVIDKYTGTGDSEKKLAEAEFVLYKMDGNSKVYYKADASTKAVSWVSSFDDATVVKTDEDGAASFPGLDSGKYYLKETAAPEGYNPLTADVEVEITASYKDSGELDTTNTTDCELTQKVENKSGTVLPETGGKGTVLLIALSAIVFVGVMVVLVTKKRMYNAG